MTESKPVILQSTANPKIRHVIRMRDNRARRKAERVLVDGWRETERAVAAGLSLVHLYLPASSALERAQRIDPDGQRSVLVSDRLMEKIAYGNSPRGVVAEFERPVKRLDQLNLPDRPLVLLLDRLEKPGNVGAIFRCADAAGIDAVLLCESADPLNPNAVRNSQGSVFFVPWASANETEMAAFLANSKIQPVAARVESSLSLWQFDFAGAWAIIVGNEADGLGDRWRTLRAGDADESAIPGVNVPMDGSSDSLNVAVTTAVICFEAKRQRAGPTGAS